jgi:hypothetical protein
MNRNPEVEQLIKRAIWWVAGAVAAGVIVTLLTGCPARSPAGLPIIGIQIEGNRVRAEVASSPEQRTRGLMYRRDLGEDEGMLFVYEDKSRLSFWMKNTFVPLSIAFLDDDGRIVHIADMAPQSTKSHKSPVAVRYALELNRGWFEKQGLAEGARVEFTLPDPSK